MKIGFFPTGREQDSQRLGTGFPTGREQDSQPVGNAIPDGREYASFSVLTISDGNRLPQYGCLDMTVMFQRVSYSLTLSPTYQVAP